MNLPNLRRCVAAAAMLAANVAWADDGIETIALSGETAPGTAGATFSSFSAPTINSFGDLSLQSTLTQGVGDATATMRDGVWLASEGTLTLVARTGVRLAGGVDEAISSFFTPGIDDARRITFYGNVNSTIDGTSHGTARFVARPIGPSTMMRFGSQAPGLPADARFTSFPVGPVTVTPSGRSAIDAVVAGYGSGIWLQQGGGLTLGLLLTGTTAPGVSPPTALSGVRLGLDINDVGEFAFQSYVGPELDYGIWTTSGGPLRKVAKIGEQAPGTPAGAVFDRMFGVAITNDGSVAFNANLQLGGGGVNSSNDDGMWIERGGSLQLLARAGEQAPGASPGILFDGFNGYSTGGNGILFYARTRDAAGSNGDGLWSNAQGSLQLIARTGDQAPGLADGARFGSFLSLNSADAAENSRGQAVFFGRLMHDAQLGIGDANDTGIWAHDSLGRLRLIVAEGGQIEVAPNDVRTVNFLSLGREINNHGEFGFVASFTDGSSGAFRALAVPEAQSLVLALTAAAAGARRRRRARG